MAKILIPGFLKRLATGRNSARRKPRMVRNLPKFYTIRAKDVIGQAEREAQSVHQPQIEVLHLLLALSLDNLSPSAKLLAKFGITPPFVRGSLSTGKASEIQKVIHPSPNYLTVLESAVSAARSLNHPYVGSEHLLLGILDFNEKSGFLTDLEMLKEKHFELKQELITLLQKPEYQPFAYIHKLPGKE